MLPGGGAPNKDTPRPPPGKVKNSGGVWTPPPGKVKNSGGVRAKKARCSLAMESTKKLTKFFFWSFFKQNGTKLDQAALRWCAFCMANFETVLS